MDRYKISLPMICVAAFALGGCKKNIMYEPSAIQSAPMQVQEGMMRENISLDDVDDQLLRGLAQHHSRHGGSAMDITVTYDPKSEYSTAMSASTRASEIADYLRESGVDHVKIGVLPIKAQGNNGRMIVSYKTYDAMAPKDCDGHMMPGIDNQEVSPQKDYKMGCSIKTQMARQVSRPSDLMGRGNTDLKTDGRSATNIVDAYRTGAPNEALDGESASGEE